MTDTTQLTDKERELVDHIAKLEVQLRVSQGRIAGLMHLIEHEDAIATHLDDCINCHGVREPENYCPEGQILWKRSRWVYRYLRDLPVPPEAAVMGAAASFHATWKVLMERAKRENAGVPDPTLVQEWREAQQHTLAQVSLLSAVDLLVEIRDMEIAPLAATEGPLQ